MATGAVSWQAVGCCNYRINHDSAVWSQHLNTPSTTRHLLQFRVCSAKPMRFKWCRVVNQSSGPIRQITRLCYVRVLLQLEADDSRTNQDHVARMFSRPGPVDLCLVSSRSHGAGPTRLTAQAYRGWILMVLTLMVLFQLESPCCICHEP